MKRKRAATSGPPVSLFAFLSVLTSAIGVLIVVISGHSALSVSQADQVVAVNETTQSGHQMKPAYLECVDKRVLIHSNGTEIFDEPNVIPWGQLEEVDQHITALIRTNRGLLDEYHRGIKPSERSINRMLEAMQNECPPGRIEIWDLLMEICRSQPAIDEIGSSETGWLPDRDETSPPRLDEEHLPESPIPDSPPDESQSKYLVMFIRPNGVETYHMCQHWARILRIETGKEALLGFGRLRLTAGTREGGGQ